MELMAAIEGLERLTRPCRVVLSTDSEYVRRGITEWVPRWRRNGWRTSQKTPVKNRDLWQRLDALDAGHEIEWRWVKGHAGHPDNERADALARFKQDRTLAAFDQMRRRRQANGPAADNRHRQVIHCPSPIMN